MTDDQVDELFQRANILLGRGLFEEAVEELRAAQSQALAQSDRESEAFFSSILASFLASRSRDEEAMAEYERAEKSDPSSPSWKIATANHLLDMGRTVEAWLKAQEILRCGLQAYEHAAYTILGLAELALENRDSAVAIFIDSTAPARVDDLPALARDLRLAEALLKAHLGRKVCLSYLAAVRLRAHSDQEAALEAYIREMEGRFLLEND